MFKHFRKLWSRAPVPAGVPPAVPADIRTSSASPKTTAPPIDPEADELDALYRQALQAMDAVETGFGKLADELPPVNDPGDSPPAAGTPPAAFTSPRPASHQGVTPQQVLEAALFVGGIDLTLKRLCSLLNDEFPPETVERFIHELNQRYESEGRPYDIRFGTGGYRMELRGDFDAVRQRVFGLGPREVKLSQDALEVLSLIAYQQPISGDRIAELRGANAAGVVRQLLRRELIALERRDDNPQDVRYCTTARFLQAFGMHTLNDLPQMDDVNFK